MTITRNDSTADILEAWNANAAPWTTAIREQQIASRQRGTDQAIVDAVIGAGAQRVLDIGCGEGWLCRALAKHSIETIGVDGVPALVAAAKAADPGGDYRVRGYAKLATLELARPVDAAVCNFSLLGETDLNAVLTGVAALLDSGSRLIIQTLHPVVACGDTPYCNGWREGSWAGISGDFAAPAPWYFRTLTGWVERINASGWQLERLAEPPDPETSMPLSLLLIATRADPRRVTDPDAARTHA